MKKYKKGFTAGTFDLFHIGHLNLINSAKEYTEYLIVGVNHTDLVKTYKKKKPVISTNDRVSIVENIKAVDEVAVMNSLDKIEAFNKFNFDVVFIGDDWKNTERWINTEKELKKIGVDVIYIPYTSAISSTKISKELMSRKNEKQ